MSAIDHAFDEQYLPLVLQQMLPTFHTLIIGVLLAPLFYVLNLGIAAWVHWMWEPEDYDDDDCAVTLVGHILESSSTGLWEEVVFRGAIQTVLGFWAGVLAFGLLHYSNRSYWGDVLRTAIWGVQLGLLFLLTGSLVPGILVHAVNNFLCGFPVTERICNWFVARFA